MARHVLALFLQLSTELLAVLQAGLGVPQLGGRSRRRLLQTVVFLLHQTQPLLQLVV
jgi:hypothetical protein